jgi:hypothetical protein
MTATRDLELGGEDLLPVDENKPSRSTADRPAVLPDRRAVS